MAKDNSSSYNDRIDAAKEKYNNATTQAEKDAAHAEAQAIRNEASKAGYTVGNYVSTSDNARTTSKDTSNYKYEGYDVATNFDRPDSVQEEVVKQNNDRNQIVDDYVNAQKQAQAAALQKAYANTLAEIEKQEGNTKDSAQAYRNAASVQSQISDNNISRFMANNGLENSGTNAQMRINSAGALQNNLGDITSNEQKALKDYADQIVLAKSNLENDLASANAGADAIRLQYQLAQLENQDERDFQKELAAINQQYALEQMAKSNDYDSIYDDTLGRNVPFDVYMYTHPSIMANYQNAMPRYSSGGGSSSNGIDYSTKDAVTAYNNYLKNTGLTMDDLPFAQWYSIMFEGGINQNVPGVGDAGVDFQIDPKYIKSSDSNETKKNDWLNWYGDSIKNAVLNNPIYSVKTEMDKINNIGNIIDKLRK